MTGHYLGEFSITYKPVGHGRGANMANSRLCVFLIHCCASAVLTYQRPAQVNGCDYVGFRLVRRRDALASPSEHDCCVRVCWKRIGRGTGSQACAPLGN